MIVAMFCVAAAMIASGVWAVFTGWELIIIERGWTQVLLGGMLLTGGLLLSGIGILAIHLKRLTTKLGQISLKPAENGAGVSMPPPPPRPELRQEPRMDVAAKPAAVPAEGGEVPEPSAMSAPAAIALGAAAGAGTAAIASAIVSASKEPQPPAQEEVADLDIHAAESPDEADSSDRLFADAEDHSDLAAADEVIPEPEGEDSIVVTMENADLERESGMNPVQGEAPQVDPTVESEAEPEALYSVPLKDTVAEEERDEEDPTVHSEVTDEFGAQAVELETPAAYVTPAERSDELEAGDRLEEPRMDEAEFAQSEHEPLLSDGSAQELPGESEGVESEPGEAIEPTEGSEPEPLPRALVGTYESGGNVYTMYSDGSIDAQTPSGNFHFSSLDELKNFIAEGGEDPLA